MNIADWQRQVHQLAREKGWWDGARTDSKGRACVDRAETIADLLSKLALVHSEVSEAVEAARLGALGLDVSTGKPEGMVVELADAVIRIMDLCEAMGLDLEGAIAAKTEYNRGRPYRHGKLA